jgi:hypothetical protein
MTLLNKARAMRAALIPPMVEKTECETAGDRAHSHAASFVEAARDGWHERIAICLEAGDIGEAEACRIAEAEIGRRFVEAFMSGKVVA